jgi:cyanophycinase
VASTLLAGLLLTGCAAGEQPEAEHSTASPGAAAGHLVIVGGGPRPAAIMEHFLELAGGPGQARIAVVPMASSEAEETGRELVEEMLELGAAEAFSLLLTRAEAGEEAARRLEGVTGVWFSGGDQNRHTAALKDTPVEAALHELYRQGAVLGGTSAGAAIMSAIMITGDEQRPGGERPSTEAFITIDRENIVTAPGFGFLDNAIVDQHFVRRKRHNRLLSLVLEHPELIGVGIDEATALVVQPGGVWQVIGNSSVVVYDPRGGQVTAAAEPVLGAAGLRLHLLPPGSTFNPATGEAALPVAGVAAR